ncbi:MAG: hypothetical protein AAGH15_11185 [Myxococcota bacterium]
MSAVPEATVARVVGEISERLADPTYAQVAVGELVESQPAVSRYLSGRTGALGSGEAVIHAAFHCGTLAACFRAHRGVPALTPVSFADLDAASGPDVAGRFAAAEPALASYVATNVDGDALRETLALVGLAMAGRGT